MLCSNLPWVFSKKLYSDPILFNIDLETSIKDDTTSINMYSLLTKAVINHAEVIIQYQAWLSSIDELHECEDLLDGEDIIEDDPDDEDGSYLVEIQATLTADNQHSFSLFELLYKIHNLLQNKDLDNLNTLDSISLAEKGEVPIYYLNFK